MRKRCSLVLILIGTLLILSASALCIYNVYKDKQSGQLAKDVLTQLKSEIIVTQPSTEQKLDEIISKQTDIFAEKQKHNSKISDTKINNNSYIGYISMPTLGLELPVMTEWSYSSLDCSPCRYSGSPYENNLIIAAHNYGSHFRRISQLNSGDPIYFTDVNGTIYEYQTAYSVLISGNDANTMISDADNSWDLTLFTCTLDGRNRFTVRAVNANQ